MLAPVFWLGIWGPADLGDCERLCGKDCGGLGAGEWGSGGFRLAFVVCCRMIRLGFERGTPPPGGWGVFCREVFCFDRFGGGVWLQNIDTKGVAAKILHSGVLRERASCDGRWSLDLLLLFLF